MEIDRLIEVYMDDCMSRQLRRRTMISYEQTLKLFARWLENNEKITHVEDIKEINIKRYIIELQSRGKYTFSADPATEAINCPQNRSDYKKKISNITINNYLRNLRAFFSWLVNSECIVKSPMNRVKQIPEQRLAKEYLEDEEVKQLVRQMDRTKFHEYRDMVIMLVMLDTGTRLGETLSIELTQLNLLERTIHLPADKTKGRKARTVFFSRRTSKELKRWIQFKDRYCESEYVFPVKHSGKAVRVNDYESNFRKYLKRMELNKHISPHTLRNNFAKRCLLSGMDIYTLSRILGHSSVSVAEKAYLDITELDLKKKYNRFSPVESIYYHED